MHLFFLSPNQFCLFKDFLKSIKYFRQYNITIHGRKREFSKIDRKLTTEDEVRDDRVSFHDFIIWALNECFINSTELFDETTPAHYRVFFVYLSVRSFFQL